MVPRFRAAGRDRLAGFLQLAWTPEPLVTVSARAGLGREWVPAGDAWTGADAVEVGTRLRPLRRPDGPLDLGLAWRATLPVAGDAGQVGTDETDMELLGELGRDLGAFRVDAAAGLAILGNPLRFANQDDVPLAWLSAAWDPGPLAAHLRVGGEIHTPRNPDRLEAVAGLETACPLRLGAEAAVGLSAAAPDWAARAWGGLAWGCRDRHGD